MRTMLLVVLFSVAALAQAPPRKLTDAEKATVYKLVAERADIQTQLAALQSQLQSKQIEIGKVVLDIQNDAKAKGFSLDRDLNWVAESPQTNGGKAGGATKPSNNPTLDEIREAERVKKLEEAKK